MAKVGDDYAVWWSTGRKSKDGAWNIATILEIKPYTGVYAQHFRWVYKLLAPHTKRGWVWMSIPISEEDLVIQEDDHGQAT